MPSPPVLTPDSLQITFFQAGRGDRFASGWVHEKIVPYVILAQALRGNYEVEFEGKAVRVKKDDVFVAPPNTPLRITHHGDRAGRFAARWIHFTCTVFHSIDLAELVRLPRQLTGVRSREFTGLMDRLENGPGGLAGMAAHREIAWAMVRMLCLSAEARPETAPLLQIGERLRPLMEWLRANLSKTITVAGMARRSGISEPRLYALFRDRLANTPQGFLKQMRLDSAAGLLVSTDATLKEIAGQTGFANPFHLSREFRKRFGSNPREFRRLNSAQAASEHPGPPSLPLT